MTKKPRKTRPGQSFNDDQVIPTLKEHWAPTLSQEAAGNLYTFAGDGSVKFQIVPVFQSIFTFTLADFTARPIHADRTPYTPAEVVNTINRGWTVPFFCSEGKEAKV
ncbi:hypothetical protein MPER_15491 [Moniliophthora perniciosa FA553]|nr:hypothetical protein MPER_15491 [Moniliophthora perniciosa FA553]